MPQAPAGQSSSDPPKRTFWLLFRPLKSHSYSQGLASKKAMDGMPEQNVRAECKSRKSEQKVRAKR